MKKIILSILMAMGVFNSCTAQSPVKILEPEEFIAAAKADTSAVILDVRQPSEYADGHLKGAINLNFLDSDAFAKGISGFKVFDRKGGILHWTELGLPVEK